MESNIALNIAQKLNEQYSMDLAKERLYKKYLIISCCVLFIALCASIYLNTKNN